MVAPYIILSLYTGDFWKLFDKKELSKKPKGFKLASKKFNIYEALRKLFGLGSSVELSCSTPHQFKLAKKTYLVPDKVVTLKFLTRNPEKAIDLPTGKHIKFHFTDKNGEVVKRSYTPTIYRTPGSFTCLIRLYKDGKMGNYIRSLKEGDSVLISGPTGHLEYLGMGNFKASKKVTTIKKLYLACGGTGLTPIYQMLTHIASDPKDKMKIVCIVAQSSPSDCLLQKELEQLQKDPRLEIHQTVSRPDQNWLSQGDRYHSGRVCLPMFKKIFGAHSEGTAAGFCGPPKFEKACKEYFKELGFPKINLHRW